MFGETKIIKLSHCFNILKFYCQMKNRIWWNSWLGNFKNLPPFYDFQQQIFWLLWKCIFTNHKVKSECMNVLHIFKILSLTHLTNAKVETIFSKMATTETNWRNCFGNVLLDSLLKLSEEGQTFEKSNPVPAIDVLLCHLKVWCQLSYFVNYFNQNQMS